MFCRLLLTAIAATLVFLSDCDRAGRRTHGRASSTLRRAATTPGRDAWRSPRPTGPTGRWPRSPGHAIWWPRRSPPSRSACSSAAERIGSTSRSCSRPRTRARRTRRSPTPPIPARSRSSAAACRSPGGQKADGPLWTTVVPGRERGQVVLPPTVRRRTASHPRPDAQRGIPPFRRAGRALHGPRRRPARPEDQSCRSSIRTTTSSPGRTWTTSWSWSTTPGRPRGTRSSRSTPRSGSLEFTAPSGWPMG